MNRRAGFGVVELLLALLVLGFVIRPVSVEGMNDRGERTTRWEWELPMAKLLTYCDNFMPKIEKSWAGIDRDFNYNKGMPVNVGKLMKGTLMNGVPLMTAGFVDNEGHFSGDFNNNADRFEQGAKGICVAFYDAAQEGMR